MLDTIGLIVSLDYKTYELLKKQALVTLRRDNKIHLDLWEYANLNQVIASSAYRVIWKLSDEKFFYSSEKSCPVLIKGFPHLKLEYSIPKFLHKHNLVSVNVFAAVDSMILLRKRFHKDFGILLPDFVQWFVNRLDVCANYIMSDGDAVKSAIFFYKSLEYPRRDASEFPDQMNMTSYKRTGLYFASKTNTLKIYAKGEEFKKNDAKRFGSLNERKEYQEFANKLLRVEVELKGRIKYIWKEKREAENVVLDEERKRIKDFVLEGESFYDFVVTKESHWNGYPLAVEFLSYVNVKNEFVRMVDMLNNGKVNKVMRSEQAFTIFIELLGSERGKNYYACWQMMSIHGKTITKKYYTKFYISKVRKFCRDNSIGMLTSDIIKLSNDQMYLPDDFSLNMEADNNYYQVPISAAFVVNG